MPDDVPINLTDDEIQFLKKIVGDCTTGVEIGLSIGALNWSEKDVDEFVDVVDRLGEKFHRAEHLLQGHTEQQIRHCNIRASGREGHN